MNFNELISLYLWVIFWCSSEINSVSFTLQNFASSIEIFICRRQVIVRYSTTPTIVPSAVPSSIVPTFSPTLATTNKPTFFLSNAPSFLITVTPSKIPTRTPSSLNPTQKPSRQPTGFSFNSQQNSRIS